MTLTKEEAKKIGIEIWDHFAKHGKLKNKKDLPKELYDKIKNMILECPCCEYFNTRDCGELKDRCPLFVNFEINTTDFACPDYAYWQSASTAKERKYYAGIIRDKLINW